jgi:hypothetical protein
MCSQCYGIACIRCCGDDSIVGTCPFCSASMNSSPDYTSDDVILLMYMDDSRGLSFDRYLSLVETVIKQA